MKTTLLYLFITALFLTFFALKSKSQNQEQPYRYSQIYTSKHNFKKAEISAKNRKVHSIMKQEDFLQNHNKPTLNTADTLNFPLPGTYSLYTSDGGGYVTGNNEYGDLAKANYFANNSSLTLTGIIFDFAIAKGGNPAIEIVVWDNSGASNSPGIVKATASIDLNTIKNDVVNEQMTFIPFDPPVVLTSSFYAGVILPTASGDTIAVWSNTDGDTNPGIAWEKWDTGAWYPMNSNQTWSRDIAMAIFPVVNLPLSADFTSDITNVQIGQSVHFMDNSIGSPTSWEWIFEGGNPATSSEQNPVVAYNEAGSFDVTLTIWEGASTHSKTVSDYITVGGIPIEVDTLNYPLTGEYAVYVTAENGFVSGNNEYGDRAKANYFQNDQNLYVTGVLVEFAYATGGNPNIQAAVWDNGGTNGTPGVKLGSQNIQMNTIKNDINNMQLTYFSFNPPVNINSSFYAGFMLPTVTGDTLVVWSNLDGDTNPGIAWEQWDNLQWYSFAHPDAWVLNVALAIFPIVQNTLGTDENYIAEPINIYPNPSSDIFNIDSEMFNQETVTVSIYRIDGKLINTMTYRNNGIITLDMTQAPSGIYFIKIETGSKSFIRKLVKQ